MIDHLIDPPRLLFRDQWPEHGRWMHAIADFKALAEVGDTSDDSIVYTALHLEARPGKTHLPTVEKYRHCRCGNGLIEIGIVKNDARRFTAQFQRYAL